MVLRTLVTIAMALILAGPACTRRADGTATAPALAGVEEGPAPSDREPSGALGIVEGSPWLPHGPTGEPVARVILDLERDFDIVPIDLDEDVPTGLGAVVVPLLSVHTQARLDRLAALIENGLPAIVIVDPLPVRHPSLVPGERSEPRGDAAAFLRRFGVSWVENGVVRTMDEPLGPEIDAARGLVLVDPPSGAEGVAHLGPILTLLPGTLAAAEGAELQPILQVRGEDAELVEAESMIDQHPLFGPRIGELDGRGVAAQGRPLVAVRSLGDGRRPDVIVIADLDALDDDLWNVRSDLEVWASSGSETTVAPGNRALLRSLVAELVAPKDAGAGPVEGAALLPAEMKDAVASIELVDRPVQRLSNDPTARAIQEAAARDGRAARWVRLHAAGAGWHVHGPRKSDADGERVASLLTDLAAAKWGAPAEAASLADPTVEKRSEALRIIARDRRGRTLVDVVVASSTASGGHFVGRSTFDERGIASLALAATPSTDPARWVAPITLNIRPADVTGLQETAHRIDVESGTLVERSRRELELSDGAWASVGDGGKIDGAKVTALLEALAKLELRPEPDASPGLFDAQLTLRMKGFFSTSGGEIVGERGATVLVLADGRRVHLLFGSLDGERQYVRVSRGESPTLATGTLCSISVAQLGDVRLLPLSNSRGKK
jgi:hypothetical protein